MFEIYRLEFKERPDSTLEQMQSLIMGHMARFTEKKVLCWLAAFVVNVLWKPPGHWS